MRKILSVKSCCFVISLKTGTLIILTIAMLGNTGFLIYEMIIRDVKHTVYGIVLELLTYIVCMSIFSLGIFGTIMKKPTFLLPFMGSMLLSIVTCIIAMIVVLIIGPTKLFNIMHIPCSKSEVEESGRIMDLVFTELAFLISIGITFYYFVIVLNFFTELWKKNRRSRTPV